MKNKINKIVVDPVIQKFLDTLASQDVPPIYKLPIQEARKVLDNVQAISIATLLADIKDLTIPVGPHGSVKIRIIRPQSNKEMLPVIIYMHGGGWVLGNKETHDRLVREIANGAQAAVVFVDYTRAPEGQYPIAHEEGYAVAKWIADNGISLNLDTSRMVIAGDSVGGLMATAIAMMAKERGEPQFIFQVLFYPVTDANFETDSYEQFAQGPWLTKPAMQWFWDNYVPIKADRDKPLVSPLQASLEQLKNLPPALIITNEFDVLRDEGEAYAHKLMQAGVPVIAMRIIGTIHDCLLLNGITEAPAIRAVIEQANQILRDVFAKKVK